MSESTHFMTPIMFCVRLEVPKVQEMARTKQEFEARHSFQTNQLGNAIVPRWKMPCEGYQEALRFIQLSLILNIGACRLAIPKVYNGTLQKHPILLIMPEIEVNLKHCGSVKPIRKVYHATDRYVIGTYIAAPVAPKYIAPNTGPRLGRAGVCVVILMSWSSEDHERSSSPFSYHIYPRPLISAPHRAPVIQASSPKVHISINKSDLGFVGDPSLYLNYAVFLQSKPKTTKYNAVSTGKGAMRLSMSAGLC